MSNKQVEIPLVGGTKLKHSRTFEILLCNNVEIPLVGGTKLKHPVTKEVDRDSGTFGRNPSGWRD